MSLYTANDYTTALQGLMPSGPVWPRDSDAVQTAVLAVLANGFQASDNAALALLVGAFPKTATILLAEWEKTLGLPDDCAIGETESVALRQAAVVAKLFSTGGQSVSYFISVAETLGYTITITQFRQARVGMSVCGDVLNGDEWPFVWRVNAPESTIIYAQAGLNYCGDPLRSWGNKRLECRLSKLSPSHTIVKFGYAG